MQMAVLVVNSVGLGLASVTQDVNLANVTLGAEKLSLDIAGAEVTLGDAIPEDDNADHAMAGENDVTSSTDRKRTAGLRLTDVVSIEQDILLQILDYCDDRDVGSASLTCTFLWLRCQRELRWRKELWDAAHLHARADGQCRTAEYPVNLEQLMQIGRLVDKQRDATSTDNAISMSKLEQILRADKRLRHSTHIYDVIYITEATSLSKISLIALRADADADEKLCFCRLVWRSAHGHLFHLFPKQAHDVAERLGYWQYFAPYFETNCRRSLPCYAVLPESSVLVKHWQDKRPLDSKEALPRQQALLGMFPVDRVNLVMELCPCTRGMSAAETGDLQRSRPRLITPARFYDTQPHCTTMHNTLWWI